MVILFILVFLIALYLNKDRLKKLTMLQIFGVALTFVLGILIGAGLILYFVYLVDEFFPDGSIRTVLRVLVVIILFWVIFMMMSKVVNRIIGKDFTDL
ncbi:hypothetical protein [Oceanobacillus kimchii]|uniref:Uncharacterized protein n=2 Tax=Oceanobacillus kimchii TaxID=746691 RepID=A0ABQ5TD40_9BACI|nr:hypothetical protein [Oceanobacillus kimchii]GLO64553.1 hypothetical protein MACH08_03370 [Oceanobacillus kimchii]